MYDRDVDPEAYAEEKGLKTVNDEGLLRSTIEKIVEDNPQSVEEMCIRDSICAFRITLRAVPLLRISFRYGWTMPIRLGL